MRNEQKKLLVASLVRTTAFVATLIITYTAARSFEAKAAVGSARPTLLIPALEESAKRNPDDAQNILDLADAMRKSGNTTDSLQLLQTSSIGRNHWQGWQRQGVLWEQIANGPAGTINHFTKATACFDRVTRVHPYYAPALEHRGLLAVKMKDWIKVASIADDLEEIDFNYLSANYLRARLAGGLGETTKALTILRHVSSQQGYPSSLFTRNKLNSEIEILQRELKP